MKTLEDRLNHAGAEVRRASTQMPPVRTPRPHVATNRLIAGVGVAVATVAVVLPLILVNLPASDTTPIVEVGQGETVLLEDPRVVRGTLGPEPAFDTSSLGVEIPLLDPSDIEGSILRVEENLLSPTDQVESHLVAGELASGSMAGIVQTTGERGWCLWIIPPTEARPSCTSRYDNSPEAVIGVNPGTDFPTDEANDLRGTYAWGPLPPEVSVVTVAYGDTTLWQRPVGGIALFDIDNPNRDHISYTAYDAHGNIVAEAVDAGAADTALATIATLMGGETLQPEELERITGPTGSASAGYLIDSTTSADGAYELGLIIYQEGPQTGSPMICFSEYAITDGVNVAGGAQCAPSQEKAEEIAAFGLGASGACGSHPKEEPVVDGNWLTLAVWGIPETTQSLTVGLGDGTSVEIATPNGVGLQIWEGQVDITSITFEGITTAQEALISGWMPIEGIADDCNQSNGNG
jgi:hypothetical protein